VKIKGIYCPAITIFNDTGDIDYDLWGKHLDHLADAGINGALIFGSIGEFYALPIEEREQAVQFAADRLRDRDIQVLAGVGDTAFKNVERMVKAAEKADVDAIVAICPYYFGPTDQTALTYYKDIAQCTDMPIVIYNFPDRTGMDINPSLAAKIVKEVPTIIGMKDTVDSASHTRHVIQSVKAVRSNVGILSGYDEYYLPTRIVGGDGVLCGLVNVEPEAFVAMHRAYEAGDYTTAVVKAKRIAHLMQVYDVCDLFISAVKCGVRVKGLPISTYIQKPARQVTQAEYEQVKRIIAESN